MSIIRRIGLLPTSWAVCLTLCGCTLADDPRSANGDELEQAARTDPENVEVWLQLGLARAGTKDWGAAIRAYDRAIDLEPRHVKAHHNLGNVYFRKGDFESAAAAYGRALELDPEYMLAAFHLGWTLRQLHRAEAAQAAFERCLAMPVDTPRGQRTRVDCVFGLGSIRHRAGDYVASAEMMQQVLEVHPTHFEARYYLGMAYRQLGRLDDAREQLSIHREMLSRRHEAMDVLVPPMDP